MSVTYEQKYLEAETVELKDGGLDRRPDMSIFQQDVLKELGWQGGTIHQVIVEIRKLRTIESEVVSTLINKVPSSSYAPDFCRFCGGYSCTDSCIRHKLTEGARDKLRVLENGLL